MPQIRKIVLDVLKPHHPNVLEFATSIAGQGSDYRVRLEVVEMDEDTESLSVIIEGTDIAFEAIVAAIGGMGGSVHSIDMVEVVAIAGIPADG
jgi:hypothetical protein